MARGASIFCACVFALCVAVACAPPPKGDPDAGPGGPGILEVDPSDGSVDVPIDKVVRITFDDHIDGHTVYGDRFRLYSGKLSKWLMAYYNPVTYQVVIWPSGHTWKHSRWFVDVREGVLGLDGEEVAEATVTNFETGGETGDDMPFEAVDYQTQIKPIFETHCTGCHGGDPDHAVAGLSLDGEENIHQTAINVETDSWPGWRLIVPSRPGRSYLMYKIIGDDRIAGDSMPRTFGTDEVALPLTMAEKKLIADWIASGAAFF